MAVDILLRRHTLLCIFIHTHPLYSVQNKHVTIDRRYADTKRISNNKKTASKKKANHRQIDDRHNEWKRKKKKLSSELTFYIVSDDDGRWSPRLSSVVIAKHAIDDSMRSPPKEEGRRRSREEKKKTERKYPHLPNSILINFEAADAVTVWFFRYSLFDNSQYFSPHFFLAFFSSARSAFFLLVCECLSLAFD